ncbi:class A beta-lactamase [Myxococcus sp. AM001]|nr:class A beta-lactamase [Myxococcus sp. AM001]
MSSETRAHHRSSRFVAALVLLAVLGTSGCAAGPAPVDARAAPMAAHGELGERLARAVAPAEGPVGVAVVLANDDADGDAVVLGGGRRFPMQSVFKLPLAMAVLDAVDRGELRRDQRVRVEPADFVSDRQHSPLRDAHPDGVELTLGELLRGAASGSDGTAADVLLGLVGGPAAVTRYLRSVNVEGVEVAVTEKEMGRDPKAQYRNWATPEGAAALLLAVEAGRGMSADGRQHLLRLLTETPTGPNRIRGRLPAGTPVAHKTGTSRTVDGITAATNDIGLVTLPDGRRLVVAVFVSESPADDATRERVIADVAREAFDFWAGDRGDCRRDTAARATVSPWRGP